MYKHAYIYIQIYTKIINIYQSNKSEKSKSFLSATTFLTYVCVYMYIYIYIYMYIIFIVHVLVTLVCQTSV